MEVAGVKKPKEVSKQNRFASLQEGELTNALAREGRRIREAKSMKSVIIRKISHACVDDCCEYRDMPVLTASDPR